MDDGGVNNPRSFGYSTEFEDKEDRQAAMVHYKFDNTRGDYINYSAAPDDLSEDNTYSAFPPKLPGYEDTDTYDHRAI